MRNEVPERVIQQLGDWSNTAMLQRYVHIKEQKRKAVQGLEDGQGEMRLAFSLNT